MKKDLTQDGRKIVGHTGFNLINIPSGTLKRGQMTIALPKALTFRVNVGNDGIEKDW